MARLIGMPGDRLRAELGVPETEHRQGDDTWLIFRTAGTVLRIRCAGGVAPVVASCTATLSRPVETLSEAAAGLGLWPACAPDIAASRVDAPAVRRAVQGPGGEAYSLMATVRAGRFTQLTVFDEPPEWLVAD